MDTWSVARFSESLLRRPHLIPYVESVFLSREALPGRTNLPTHSTNLEIAREPLKQLRLIFFGESTNTLDGLQLKEDFATIPWGIFHDICTRSSKTLEALNPLTLSDTPLDASSFLAPFGLLQNLRVLCWKSRNIIDLNSFCF